jgi:hypothetical protein
LTGGYIQTRGTCKEGAMGKVLAGAVVVDMVVEGHITEKLDELSP